MKEEIPYIHYLRILACLGVLTLHCNNRIIFNNDYDAIFAKIIHTLAQPCVPLFFYDYRGSHPNTLQRENNQHGRIL